MLYFGYKSVFSTSVIIGKNNCGKTSILSILKKCIGYDKKEKQFEYFDFSISF